MEHAVKTGSVNEGLDVFLKRFILEKSVPIQNLNQRIDKWLADDFETLSESFDECLVFFLLFDPLFTESLEIKTKLFKIYSKYLSLKTREASTLHRVIDSYVKMLLGMPTEENLLKDVEFDLSSFPALIIFYLLLCEGKPSLKETSFVLDAGTYFLSQFDKNFTFPLSLWCSEKQAREECPYTLLSLLFDVCYSLSEDSSFKEASEKLLENSEYKVLNWVTVARKILQEKLLSNPRLLDEPVVEGQDTVQRNKVLALNDFQANFKLTGENTAPIFFSKKDIQIVALGPHYGSLGDMSSFGVNYPLGRGVEEKKLGLDCHMSADYLYVDGWSRTYSKDKSHGEWFFSSMEIKSSVVELKVKFLEENLSHEKRHVLAFLKSDAITVDNLYSLAPNSLDRFEGEGKEILLRTNDLSLSLEVSKPHSFAVIPLSGRDYYWGANFLLAFEISSDKPLSINLR